MKKQFLMGLLSMAVLGLSSCSNDDNPELSSETGHMSLRLGLDNSVISAEGSRAEYSDVTVNDLTLKLSSADGSYVKEGTVADFGEDVEFKVGDYTLEAYYGSSEEDGFEKPYFYGSQSIKITENNLTPVNLTASLSNSMVSISYTDAFKNYFTSYSASVLSSASRTTAYTSDETRPAYIAAGNAKLFVDVTKPNGTSATLQPAEFVALPKHHYRVTLDVNNGGVGEAKLVITFDETLDKEDVEIELSDELMNAPAPVITIPGYTPDSDGTVNVDVVEGVPFSGELKMSIVARGKLAQVPMVTVSPSLKDKGWPVDVDLIAATDGQQALLKQLGLSAMGLWHNPDKLAVVDFSGVFANLKYKDGDSNANRFTVYVKDSFTKVCDPVTIVVNVQKATLSFANVIMESEDVISADLNYNGSDLPTLNDNVTIQVKNNRATWTNASYTYTQDTPVKARSMANPLFHLTISLPADAQANADGSYLMRAVTASNAVISSTVTVKPRPREVAVAAPANDVWAKYAFVTVTSLNDEYTDVQMAANATIFVKAAGASDFTPAAIEKTEGSNVIKVTGLVPGTAYVVKARVFNDADRESRPLSITTENSTQLPNNDMETWFRVNGQTSYWWIDYPGADTNAEWGTLNLLTTSEGGNQTTWVNRNGCSYSAFSGTQPTDDAHNGKAAYIATVGWGKGNSAAAISGMGTCQKINPGELYLGSYNTSTQAPDYGYAFSCRPLGMSFWYKYTARNEADYGYAEISVLDAAGNVLATSTQNLSAIAEYTKVDLNLSYVEAAAKATSIKVVFKSSANPDCLAINATNLSYPPARNTSNGRYTGSELYIDDITLNY